MSSEQPTVNKPSARDAMPSQTQVAGKTPHKDAETIAPGELAAATTVPGGKPQKADKASSMLGPYKLLKKLGEGGMGAVYKAQKAGERTYVAVKVLGKELGRKETFVLRFQREARVMTKLDHPHILGCLDVGEDRARHYLVMEFIEGGSVESWLKKLGRFELGDALHIILKTAQGLQHAHECSMIHRDIKPDNILLTKEGVVKIADLGLAKDTEEDISLTRTGAGAGTPIYMAPEQARDAKHVDIRTDIYALGVMLYVFLTGRAPFQGSTIVQVITAKEKGVYDPIRKHNPDVPPKIDLIVGKMMAKDVKYRYGSCDELIEALEPLGLAHEQLSFFSNGGEDAPPMAHAGAPTTLADKRPKHATHVGAKGAGKTTAAAESISMAPTTFPDEPDEEERTDPNVWFMQIKGVGGAVIAKEVTTDQVRMLIKAGHIDAQTQISKTAARGFRSAATFAEFQSFFKAREAADKAKAKGKQYDQIYKDLADQDASRKRWRWLTRGASGVLRLAVGLLVILAVVGGVGFGGWYVWTNFLR